MIILRQIIERLFSTKFSKNDETLKRLSDTFVQELIKLLVFSKRDKEDIRHWSQELGGYIKTVNNLPEGLLFLSLVDNYKNLPRKKYREEFITNLRHGKSLKDYIKSQYDFLYKQMDKKHGIKYKDLIDLLQKNNEIPEDEVFIQQAKYLLLRLNGQIGEDINWYDPIVQSMQVNWELKLGTDRAKDIEEIIKNI